nr:hypothetical protein [Candidatus Cloacimonadota bacterium]
MSWKIVFVALCLVSPFLLQALSQDPHMAYLEDYLRVRSDLSGKDSIMHIQGNVYAMIPEERTMKLFAVEGYHISRVEKVEGGYRLLSKEILLFKDPITKQICTNWRNHVTGKSLPVIHIFNDPVNQSFVYQNHMMPYIRQIIPSEDLSDTRIYHNEIFPFHPSLLPRREFSANVQSDIFQAAEISSYRAHHEALADTSLTSVPTQFDWVWISPWLPFMEMADREGQLLFVCRGEKLTGGFPALPNDIKNFVLSENEDFSEAPQEWEDTSINPWSYYKSLFTEEEEPEE